MEVVSEKLIGKLKEVLNKDVNYSITAQDIPIWVFMKIWTEKHQSDIKNTFTLKEGNKYRIIIRYQDDILKQSSEWKKFAEKDSEPKDGDWAGWLCLSYSFPGGPFAKLEFFVGRPPYAYQHSQEDPFLSMVSGRSHVVMVQQGVFSITGPEDFVIIDAVRATMDNMVAIARTVPNKPLASSKVTVV